MIKMHKRDFSYAIGDRVRGKIWGNTLDIGPVWTRITALLRTGFDSIDCFGNRTWFAYGDYEWEPAPAPPMTYDEWLKTGMALNYCGPAVCSMHDGVPTSLEEDFELDDGKDPCLFVIRVYLDAEHATAVESNHSPSVWRKP